MKKNPLIATDLDGTLLNNQGEISDFTKTVIEAVMTAGHVFVPCTSRAYKELPECLLTTAIQYYVCSNGAIIWDQQNKEVINSHLLSVANTLKIIELLQDYDKATTLAINGCLYCDKSLPEILKKHNVDKAVVERILSRRMVMDDLREVLAKHQAIDKLHFNFLDIKTTEICRALIPNTKEINVTSSSLINLEITDKKATKGRAVLDLCEKLALNKEQIIAFGDNKNDLQLFEVATLKVAVNNAQAELKAQADVVLELSNDEDALANFLQQHLDLA